ncbi:tail fiber protein [Paenibacillus sp. UMB4589-SE434]|uniref:phage tail protein n=1 Tax=Paenibacillus sp. UMB4589-SE434 TaxID=3046314 RepID=UPI002550EAA5|nr:tail fiber protein [Paenibacillus sp. UMB4589-SE434]MDK8182737.1 tail fiber protein [Paenibacillus sp. UMB4589-SE434]
MSEPFLAEIRLFPYGFAPKGWLPCEGQILNINTNQALYSLLGVTYGGDGRTTFALPNLKGRVPIHTSPTHPFGQSQGEAAHTLTINEMPVHTHTARASSQPPSLPSAQDNVWAAPVTESYAPLTAAPDLMSVNALAAAGGNQPHNNMQPYLSLQFCIATVGIYPSRS